MIMTRSEFYTIGYEGAKPEGFAAALKNAGVAVLLDIRAVAWSRKAGFSKEPLRTLLAAHGIDYVHLKGLGNPRPKPGEPRSFNGFAAHLETAEAQADLVRAAEIVTSRAACLLCFEKNPLECHRNLVAPVLAERTGLAQVDLFVEADPAQLSLLG